MSPGVTSRGAVVGTSLVTPWREEAPARSSNPPIHLQRDPRVCFLKGQEGQGPLCLETPQGPPLPGE